MKRLLNIIAGLSLIITPIATVSGCYSTYKGITYQADLTCAMVSDLEERSQQTIKPDRSTTDLFDYLHSIGIQPDDRQTQFISACQQVAWYAAKKSDIDKFNDDWKDTSNFTSINDLQNQIDNFIINPDPTLMTHPNVPLKDIISRLAPVQQVDGASDLVNKFFNVMAKIYGKDNVLRLLWKMFSSTTISNTVAVTALWGNKSVPSIGIQTMTMGPNSFNPSMAFANYRVGGWSSGSIISTIVHEYGHALENYVSYNYTSTNFNADARQDDDTNKYAYNQPTSLKQANNLKSKHRQLKNNRVIASDFFIQTLAAETNVQADYYKTLLSQAIVTSNYGRSNTHELFAEAFAQWILAPDNLKNVAWEKENEFFMEILPNAYFA